MKKLLFICGACVSLSLLAINAGAVNQWWDNNGTGTPTSGVWVTTTPNWTGSVSSNLTASTVPFTNGNFAEFAAGSGTITALTITVPGAVTCAGLATGLNAATVTTTTFSGAGSINLTTTGGATVTGGGSTLFQGIFCGPSGSDSLVFNVPITGSAGLEQHSSGSMTLDATNTYSGGTDLTGGQLIFYNNSGSFGTGPIIVNGNGNALVSGSTSLVTIPNNIIFPQAEALNLAGNFVGTTPGTIYSGTVTLPTSGVVNLETSSTVGTVVEMSGVISGAGVLETSDDGTLQLGGVNTYTGNTAIASPATLSIVGAGQLGSGSYSGTITNNSVFIYKSSAPQTLSGVISGTGKLTNSGTGTLTLAAINTYTNTTTVNGGSGCVLQLGDGVSKSGTVGGAIAVTSPASLVLAPGGSTVTYNSSLQIISGTGAVTMNGPGTFIIGGNHNTYTGGTIINGGILQTGGDLNLGAAPGSFQAANITLGGGTLQGNNPNFAFVANRGVTLTANSGLSSTISGTGPIPDQGELGIQGPITDNNAGFGIIITGQTNLTTGLLSGVYLEGTNTYTGPTVVASGVLSLFANGSINSSSSISIASGAAFDVSSNTATTWNLNQPLVANGSGVGLPGFLTVAPTPAAILIGASGGSINFGGQALMLSITPTNFNGDGNQPALYVSQGSVVVNGNTVYVTNNGASPLGYGTYTLIQQAAGNISVIGVPTLGGGVVSGNGIVANATATLAVSGGALNLVVAPSAGNPGAPYFSNLTPAPGFVYGGASSVVLSGTVSNLSGGVATSGDTITVQVGSLGAQPATIGANGSFGVTYTLPAFTAAGYYPISYTYSGALGAASDSSTTLQISQALLSATASDPSRNYNGNTTASVTLTPAPLNGDSVTISGSATPFGGTNFASANVGTGITVTITGLKLAGAAAANYYLPSTFTLSGNINTPGFTWDGLDSVTNSDFQWGDQFNWVGNVAPDLIGDSLDFGGTTGLVPVVQAAYTNWSVTFDSTAGSFVVTNLGTAVGFAIGAGGITNNSTSTQTIAVPVNALSSSSSLWYVTNGSSLIMSSNVSDAGGGITLAGAGTLNLAGSNNAVTGPFTNLAGTLEITGGAKLGNGTYAAAFNNNGTFIFNSTSNQTLSGVISGSGSLTEAGTGSLTLSGANTFTGLINITTGLLAISSDANLGAAPGSAVANQMTLNSGLTANFGLRVAGNMTMNANRGITLGSAGGEIQVASGDTLTYNGVITGAGTLQTGTSPTVGEGILVLGGANNYTGGTIAGCGTLRLGASGALPSGTSLTVASAAVGGTLILTATARPLARWPAARASTAPAPSPLASC